ncbi:MAG: Maf family protein [Candidatus Hermodarchaeota archaeon]
MKKIILASKSNDRSEIFKRARIPFETFITNINEEKYIAQFSDPVELVKEIAKQKALFAKNKLLEESSNPIIIAADTLVEINEEIIGKAQNNSEAFKILKKLMGKAHKLITGIAITDIENPKMILDSDITIVEFLELSDDEILEYIKTDEWKGRAGAYSINDRASLFINKINGSSSNVIGLPMQKLYKLLKKEFDINLFQLE